MEINGLDIKKINPKNHTRYSPNLFRWLTNRNNKHRAWSSKVYRRNGETLWIGIIDDGDFIGTRLMSVLCNGSKDIGGCHCGVSKEFVEIDDFWNRYMAVGRCAIDTDHNMYFIGDETRWMAEKDTRDCIWCGEVRQILKKWTETVEREKWVNE